MKKLGNLVSSIVRGVQKSRQGFKRVFGDTPQFSDEIKSDKVSERVSIRRRNKRKREQLDIGRDMRSKVSRRNKKEKDNKDRRRFY